MNVDKQTQRDSQELRQNFEMLEQERREIAYALHNEMGQQLTAIRTAAQLMIRQSEGRQTHPVAQTIVELTDGMFTQMYHMLQRLRPSTLDKLGLIAALEDLVLLNHEQLQLTTSLELDGDAEATEQSMNADLKLAIYRIVQEALTNAVRHGQAKMAKVLLRKEGNRLKLEVSNNGQALDAALDSLLQRKRSSVGLFGIKQRVQAWGGEMYFENAGQQVVLTCLFPLDF